MGGLRLLPTPTKRVWTRPWHSMRRTTEAGPSFAQMLQSSPTRAKAREKTARTARIRARKARRAKRERHLQRRSPRALVPWLSQLERRQHLPILIPSELSSRFELLVAKVLDTSQISSGCFCSRLAAHTAPRAMFNLFNLRVVLDV